MNWVMAGAERVRVPAPTLVRPPDEPPMMLLIAPAVAPAARALLAKKENLRLLEIVRRHLSAQTLKTRLDARLDAHRLLE